jgi:hypothetical protein
VDFARLLDNFPNLELINLENNPLSGSGLASLNNQQFSRLVELMKTKKQKNKKTKKQKNKKLILERELFC